MTTTADINKRYKRLTRSEPTHSELRHITAGLAQRLIDYRLLGMSRTEFILLCVSDEVQSIKHVNKKVRTALLTEGKRIFSAMVTVDDARRHLNLDIKI